MFSCTNAIHCLITGFRFSPIICGVHQDLHDEQTLQQLAYMATSIITLSSTSAAEYSVICHVLHKRPNGKILRSVSIHVF